MPDGPKVYVLEHNHAHVMMRIQRGALDELDWPHLHAHSFNRLGPLAQWDTMEYFPYGYIYRETGMGGPIDAFGFRIGGDLAAIAAERNDSELLVAVVGGSAAWSWYCFPDEMFPELLQTRLNVYLESIGSRRRARVLNFGQGAATVLNEIEVFLLHIEALRPNIVISHDGFNDALWGMTADPFLMRRGICAQHTFEAWSPRLHDRMDQPLRFPHAQPVTVVNGPEPIIKGYLARKRQLDRIVRGTGAAHIPGLQPYSGSKGARSAQEESNLSQQRYTWVWAEPNRRMPLLYDMVSKAFDSAFPHSVNCHTTFKRFGADVTLFQDMVHATPEGDLQIADLYADRLIADGLVS
jgi:hypothetical protein